jgi:methionyl-tRNA formyltransferase
VRVVFFGTPDVARVGLDALLQSRHEVVAVVTQPDRAKGRSGTPQPSPAKQRAIEAGIPVLQPQTPKQEGFAEELKTYEPQVLGVVAYGHLLPIPVLEVAPAINAHFSLLPRYRGAAPVQRAILAGDAETGVTTFLLEPTMDSGPMLMQERVPIRPAETAGELMQRLAPVGANLLVRSIDALEDGTLVQTKQDVSLATPAPKVSTEEARIDWSLPAERIVAQVHAFNPAPGAWTTWAGKRVKVWRAEAGQSEPGDPGAPARSVDEVHAGSDVVRLLEVQPEGGRRMSGAEFARGYASKGSGRFGDAS